MVKCQFKCFEIRYNNKCGGINVNIINNYLNTKKELESVRVRLQTYFEYENIINKRKEELHELGVSLSNSLKIIEGYLKELTGIENELFYLIIVKGMSVTKAVDKVAFNNDKEVSTIWKNYYPKVKKIINELVNNSSNSQVII